jgi:hypothetical protein
MSTALKKGGENVSVRALLNIIIFLLIGVPHNPFFICESVPNEPVAVTLYCPLFGL